MVATVPPSIPKAFISGLQKVGANALKNQRVDFGQIGALFRQAAPYCLNYSLIGPVSMTLLFVRLSLSSHISRP